MRPAPYHGWIMVWSLAVSTTVGYGILYYSFAVFIKSMETELGWNRAQTSASFSVAAVVAGLCAPWMGRLVDRHGTRGVIAGGALAASLLVFAWSRVTTLPMLYAIAAALGVTMTALFYDPAFTAVAVWFRAERARALLVITLVAGLASTIFVPLSTLLLEHLGWRNAAAVLAGILLLLVPLAWLTLRRHPHDLGLEVDGRAVEPIAPVNNPPPATREWLRSRVFWSVAAAFALARIATAALSQHLVPLLVERGYTAAITATAAAMVGVLQLAGRLVISPLSGTGSRVSLIALTALTFVVHGLGVVLLASQTDVGVWGFVILYGSTNGAITIARAALTAELFDTRIYGMVGGSISFVVSLSSALMPFVAGALHEQSGDYQSTLWLLVATTFASGVIVLGAKR